MTAILSCSFHGDAIAKKLSRRFCLSRYDTQHSCTRTPPRWAPRRTRSEDPAAPGHVEFLRCVTSSRCRFQVENSKLDLVLLELEHQEAVSKQEELAGIPISHQSLHECCGGIRKKQSRNLQHICSLPQDVWIPIFRRIAPRLPHNLFQLQKQTSPTLLGFVS